MDPEVPLNETMNRFEGYLAVVGKSANTPDLRFFGEWFALTNAKALSPDGITPVDVREYRSYHL